VQALSRNRGKHFDDKDGASGEKGDVDIWLTWVSQTTRLSSSYHASRSQNQGLKPQAQRRAAMLWRSHHTILSTCTIVIPRRFLHKPMDHSAATRQII
jgi:hypothetical protein